MQGFIKTIALVCAVAALMQPREAEARMVAGWDFSQYVADGLLSIDFDINPIAALPANYSHFDPTFNAGVESADFGTFHYDGQFGSSAISIDLTATEDLIPVTGSLQSNLDAPVDVETGFLNPFESFTILIDEGQNFAGQLRMEASGPVSVVFRAVLPEAFPAQREWLISFGGQTRPTPEAPIETTGPSTVGVEFAPDCAGYSSVDSVVLDGNDQRFERTFQADPATSVCARLNFNPDGLYNPTIDNVAIFVPEPTVGAGVAAALGALAIVSRRKNRDRVGA